VVNDKIAAGLAAPREPAGAEWNGATHWEDVLCGHRFYTLVETIG